MNTYKLLCKAVIDDKVIDNAAICVDNGIITYAGEETYSPAYDNTIKVDGLVVPGFIDIHCHGGNGLYCQEDFYGFSKFHLDHGTTTLCATLYRDVAIKDMITFSDEFFETVKKDECTNVYGVHLEGPYLNPIYGSKSDGIELVPVYDEYIGLIDHPFIKHITFAPEVRGTDKLLKDIVDRGILASIGHSSASPEDVNWAVDGGASNVTHLFDATGCSISPTRVVGTIEVDFNTAVLLRDNVTYEIICDRDGIHVRYDNIRLVKKIAGVENIIAITDCCGGHGEGYDVNFVDGELSGSKLTMNQAFRNFVSVGFSLPEVVKVTSSNPARALKIDNVVGSISKNKFADLVVLDENYDVIKVFKSSKSYKLK